MQTYLNFDREPFRKFKLSKTYRLGRNSEETNNKHGKKLKKLSKNYFLKRH